MAKQTKIDVAKRIAEGAAYTASVHAGEARKKASEAEAIAHDVAAMVEEVKGLPADLQKGFEQQVDALRKQFEEAVKGLVERLESAVKEVDGKVAVATDGLDACVGAAHGTLEVAELANAAASRAEGSIGRLNELGFKPVELGPEPVAVEAPTTEPVPVESAPAT